MSFKGVTRVIVKGVASLIVKGVTRIIDKGVASLIAKGVARHTMSRVSFTTSCQGCAQSHNIKNVALHTMSKMWSVTLPRVWPVTPYQRIGYSTSHYAEDVALHTVPRLWQRQCIITTRKTVERVLAIISEIL